MFHSEITRIPRATPVTAESVAAAEMTTTRTIWVTSAGSTPNRTPSPTAICRAPSPSEVATPKTAPNTARRSTPCPIGPWIRSPISG